MKLNNVKDKDIKTKFNTTDDPKKQAWYLKPIIWTLSCPSFLLGKVKINKHNMEKLEEPCIVLCTHQADSNFKIATLALFPHSSSHVVTIENFIGREKIMKKAGFIGIRNYNQDQDLIKRISYSINVLKQTVVIYPEVSGSIYGANGILMKNLGEICKSVKAPVALLNIQGSYINSSKWNQNKKRTLITADMSQIIKKEDIKKLDAKQIDEIIGRAFKYDEYDYQKNNDIFVKNAKRCEGLEKVLYKCPSCKAEFKMITEESELVCTACHKRYHLEKNGEIVAVGLKTEYPHIPDWVNWQRECVKQEIIAGKYKIEDEVDVDTLPNSKGFINLGDGHFTHDKNGLKVVFNENNKTKVFASKPLDNYTCRIEFNYNDKGDCVFFSDNKDTYYFYFKNLKNIIVKVMLAVEELYKLNSEK